MQKSEKFSNKPKKFWAQVKLISMKLGYSKGDEIKKHSAEDIVKCLETIGLDGSHIIKNGKVTNEGQDLVDYFKFRSDFLAKNAEKNLMNRDQAKEVFDKLRAESKIDVPLPLNKQKGEKRHHAYLTGIVNMLTAKALGNADFDHDPRSLIVITNGDSPIQTLSRRVDGAYPSTTNPRAIWEIKEYYGTTTFGSRVADGVYETLLDGYELDDLRSSDDIKVGHYLIVDDYYTWWSCGKSYLCRMVDMMHAGFVDEVIFGKEILDRWSKIVRSWK
ncbi:MAG: hypothetical protein ACJKTH_03340 [Patescibacteria group bacterium UBA2163]